MNYTQIANGIAVGMSELLACPYCGSRPKVVTHRLLWFARYHIECSLCQNHGPGNETSADLQELATIWNTRHANGRSEPQRENEHEKH